MPNIDRRNLRTILVSSGVTIAALAVFLQFVVTSDSSAQSCTYSVTTSSTPGSANWKDISGFWNPPNDGTYPGESSSCNTASDTNGVATTIVVDSAIPFQIAGLDLLCSTPGCVVDIQTGGSLTLAGPGTIGDGVNLATLKVSGGTLHIASGATLTFQSGSQFEFDSGTVDIQTGGMIAFPAGSSGMSTGGVLSGGGTLSITGGTFNIGGVTSPGVFVMTSGVLTGAGFLSVGNSMTWSGGTITGSGGAELAGTGSAVFDGSAGTMILDGRSFNNYGVVHYTGTTNSLQLANGAAFSTYGTFLFEDDNSITCNCAGTPPSFNVFPNGFVEKVGGTMTSTVFTPSINNANVFAFTGTLEFAGNNLNSGGFFATSGNTIKFSAPSSTFDSSSGIGTDSNGTILFSAGNAVFNGGFYDVQGLTSIAGGNVGIKTSALTHNFSFTSGTLTVENDFTMDGTGTWSGGTMNGLGDFFDVAPGATLTIDAATGIPTIDGLFFANDGTVNYTATVASGNYLEFDNSPVFDNTGLFDIQTDVKINVGAPVIIGMSMSQHPPAIRKLGERSVRRRTAALSAKQHFHPLTLCGCLPPGFDNDLGTLQKSAGTGTTDFFPPIDNTGAVKALIGTLSFHDQYNQNDGSTTLGPGNLAVASPNNFELNAGILDGIGTLTGNLDNQSEVKPGTSSTTGVINLTGNYLGGSGGTLTIKIAGPSAGQFDQLNVTGTATLDGTFGATFINGYTPATGTTVWSPLTFASSSGAFATVNLPTYTGGVVTSAYTPTSFNLTAVTAPAADLKLLMGGPPSVNAGAPLSYTVNVSNLGPDPASGTITVANTLPAGATAATGSGTGWTCGAPSGGVITCTNPGPLNSGNSLQTLTFNMTAPAASGNVTNSATVSNATADPNSPNNTASVVTNVGPQANLSIVKSGPPSVTAGQNIVYTVVVTNNGPSPATGTVVSDPTPVGIAFISNTGACTTTYPCSLGTLNAGQSVTITSTYNVPSSYSGPSVSNTATVSSAVNDPNIADNSSTVTTTVTAVVSGSADLSITKSGPPSVTLGSAIAYNVTVTNGGPLAAASTFVADPTPAGLTFLSNSGACSGPYPCALGTLNNGQSVVITSTYSVPANYAGTSISNTATVSSSTSDSNSANNTATAVTPVAATGVADLNVTKGGPAQATANGIVDFTIVVFNNGPNPATNIVISDPTPNGLTYLSSDGACSTPYPCVVASLGAGKLLSVTGHYRVVAPSGSITNTASATSSETDPNPSNNTSSAAVSITPATSCPQPPILTSPALGATVTSPVTFSWIAVPNATGYILSIITNGNTQTFSTTTTTMTQPLSNGAYTWSVQVLGPSNCPPASTLVSPFSVCNNPGVPIASVVGVTTTGQTYTVQWTPTEGTTAYELQESGDATFTSSTSTAVAGTAQTFTKNIQIPTAFYYRVRAVAGCSPTAGPFSLTAAIVIVPPPPLGTINPNVVVPAGSTQPVTFQIHVNGLPGLTSSFLATVDKPWLSVTPTSGIMPPEGLNFTISTDPSTLQNGTWTGTVIIIFGSSISGKNALDAAPKQSIPVSISLVTPVTPATLTGPAATAAVIPSVGHLAGFDSQWQSDIRIANITALVKNVQLTFSSGSATSQAVKQTTLNIAAGATTALDDIVRNWFGTGAMGDSSNGVLTVQPLDAAGKPDLSVVKSVAVSSRTFNTSATGTLGQFIPAVPLANFISKAPGAASILALQQIAQNATFRTNLGLVEATGKPASVLVSVFNGAGSKLLDLPFSLAGGEQRQLSSFLATNGITLTNGHIEVQATGGDGKVTAYASVVDDGTSDPLLVSGVPLGGTGASRYVIPGVASLDSGATWRSDVRIFNNSATPQTATLTLYPTGNPASNVATSVTIQPGEVKALDDIVHTTFNLTNAGGALHVTTAVATPLVVTARTYDVTTTGTLGQFLQAVTPADAVGSGERSLQLLQMEDSPRYRTNLGLAEVTGKSVTAEVTVILPDSKVAPKVSIPLGPFEYRQFPIITSLGLSNAYNARISIRVIDGQGKVTAYGSVIDQKTQDPTYVPAQ